MHQDELALDKSITSGDTDLSTNTNNFLILILVYLALFQMKRKLSAPDFFRLINGKELACRLLEVYAKKQDLNLLRDFYYQSDYRILNANLIVSSSYKEKVRILV
jgi:hypothetical protein